MGISKEERKLLSQNSIKEHKRKLLSAIVNNMSPKWQYWNDYFRKVCQSYGKSLEYMTVGNAFAKWVADNSIYEKYLTEKGQTKKRLISCPIEYIDKHSEKMQFRLKDGIR